MLSESAKAYRKRGLLAEKRTALRERSYKGLLRRPAARATRSTRALFAVFGAEPQRHPIGQRPTTSGPGSTQARPAHATGRPVRPRQSGAHRAEAGLGSQDWLEHAARPAASAPRRRARPLPVGMPGPARFEIQPQCPGPPCPASTASGSQPASLRQGILAVAASGSLAPAG